MPVFTGRDEDWSSWLAKVQAFFTLMNWDEVINLVESTDESLSVMNTAIDASHLSTSKQLHAMLTVKLEKRAMAIVTRAGKGEGFHAWRLLRTEFEPKVGNRFAAMLSGLLNPIEWKQGDKPFAES